MTFYKDNFRDQKRFEAEREQDREQWADLSKVEFEFDINGLGEGISEPIYFGRAYDSPPRFTYSLTGGFDDVFEEVRAITWPTVGMGGPAIASPTDPYSLDLPLLVNHPNVGAQDATPVGMAFSAAGDKMFMVGDSGNRIVEYTITDLSLQGLTFVQNFSISGQTTAPYHVRLKPDGTKMYVLGSSRLFQYSLPTPWSLTGASYDGVSFNFTGQDTVMTGLDISLDGTRLMAVGVQNDRLYSYTFNTAWDVNSLQYDSFYQLEDSSTYSYEGIAVAGSGMFAAVIRTDQTASGPLFDSRGALVQYDFGTAWDASTVTGSEFRFTTTNSIPIAVSYSPDGSFLYIMGLNGDSIYVHSLNADVSMRADRLRWDGWIEDPQFERQMQWGDPYIPDFDDLSRYEYGQKIYEDVAGETVFEGSQYASFRSRPGMVNTWFQGFPLGCTNPYVTGDLLPDPGFESQLSTWGGGPGGNEIPGAVLTDFSEMEWDDGSFSNPASTFWSYRRASSGYSVQTCKIITDNPRSGTHHVEARGHRSAGGTSSFTVTAVNLRNCSSGAYYSCVLQEGSVVDISGYVLLASGSSGFASTSIVWYDENDLFITSDNSSIINLTSEYQLMSGSFVSPANVKFARVGILVGGFTSSDERVMYVDDVSMVVS